MGLPKDCKLNLLSRFPKGERNLITDVPGVKVGHSTLENEERHIHTGVTAILPHGGNLFREKVAAGVSIINGFGKSAGLLQIEELGNIETPILMTNTLGVGTGLNALTKYMLRDNEDIGRTTGTVNCVVTECNDGSINDIRGMHLKEEHFAEALECAGENFAEGSVGAGTGMCCMGLKGGIGSASRIVNYDGKDYVVGAILMSNFGKKGRLRIDGKLVDISEDVLADDCCCEKPERGSVIVVLGTDLPLSDRQLRRMAMRAAAGLARVGSFYGNGSGDIAIAFSNGNIIPHYSESKIIDVKMLADDCLDNVFEATTEAVEEAVVSSLYFAAAVTGMKGKLIHALSEYI